MNEIAGLCGRILTAKSARASAKLAKDDFLPSNRNFLTRLTLPIHESDADLLVFITVWWLPSLQFFVYLYWELGEP
jgi:hypothetical protein